MKMLTKIVTQRLQDIDRRPAEAERIGQLGKGFLSDILADRKDGIQSRNLAKLAKALDWSVDQLQRALMQGGPARPANQTTSLNIMDLPADVPVLGTAAASVAGAFILDQSAIEYVRRPPGVATARNIYALYVQGESMLPRHRPGDLIFVSPDRPATRGDDVIIQTRNHDQSPIESWLKTFSRRNDEYLFAEQLNPSAEIKFATRQIIGVHRVLTMRELFGV